MRMRALFPLSLTLILMSFACSTPAPHAASGLPTPLSLPIEQIDDAALTRGQDGQLTVSLVQRPCRFEQAEPGASLNIQRPKSAKDCREVNDKTLSARRHHALALPAGQLTFVVSSEDVPYELGFWIRPYDEPERALVQGGGILPGQPKTYTVNLPPGRYLYSCPLNPTPDYVLIVR